VITLTGGNFGVPNGSIRFQLNQDARVVAAPYGQVPAALVVTYQLDAFGNLIQPCPIWSNAELTPQLSNVLLGTFYLVSVYSQSGALVSGPMRWIFPNFAGSTVNISTMTALEVE
jgi:hypothetical protein